MNKLLLAAVFALVPVVASAQQRWSGANSPSPPSAPPSATSPEPSTGPAVTPRRQAPALAIGPSFDCRKANTALALLICSDPDLSKVDLLFVRPYFALRQMVGPTGWQPLKQEAINFQAATERECGIPASGTLPSNRAVLKTCIENVYARQMTAWRYRLSGPALEETARSIEQHITLQTKLQELGFLPSTEVVDGVYGSSTRTAIQNWQSVSGLKVTGFLGDDDAQRLISSSGPAAPTPSQPLAQTRESEPPAASFVQRALSPASIPSMDIVDFLVDGRDFVGRRVTITGCEFRSADMSTVLCATRGGHVYVDSRSLERESFRRALRNCAGPAFNHNPDCMGDVTGQVTLNDVLGLFINDSVIKWSAFPETSIPQQSSPVRSAPPTPAGLDLERQLIDAVQAARSQYDSGQSDIEKGASRPARAQAICKILASNRRVENWTGTVKHLSTNTDGKGVLYVEIAQNIAVETWNNALSDIFDDTLIDPASEVYKSVVSMHEGQKVRFGGTFLPSDATV